MIYDDDDWLREKAAKGLKKIRPVVDGRWHFEVALSAIHGS